MATYLKSLFQYNFFVLCSCTATAIQLNFHSKLLCTYSLHLSYSSDHKAQYQKLSASCSFFMHKVHWIIRRIK